VVLELSEFELIIDVGRGRPVTRAGRDPFREELRDFIVAAAGGDNRIRASYAEALRTQCLTVAATDVAAADQERLAGPLTLGRPGTSGVSREDPRAPTGS
jgi:hypothetical protein